MYLYKKLYCKNWSHMKASEKYNITVKQGRKKVDSIKPERICYITEEVMYWRKANQIHNWFVKYVQNGKDDCKEYWVSRDKLQNLLTLCEQVLQASELVEGDVNNGYTMKQGEDGKIVRKYYVEKGKVIKDPSVAQELLPATEGFFFGSTDYNEWYYNDVKDTADKIKELLAEKPESDFYYEASW